MLYYLVQYTIIIYYDILFNDCPGRPQVASWGGGAVSGRRWLGFALAPCHGRSHGRSAKVTIIVYDICMYNNNIYIYIYMYVCVYM